MSICKPKKIKMRFELTEFGCVDGLLRHCDARVDASATAYGDPECLIGQRAAGDAYWESPSSARDPFVQFDFGDDARVAIDGYTLVSAPNEMSDRVPTDWLLAGSNDQEDWVILDDVAGSSALRGAGQAASFSCDSQNAFFRYVRLQMPAVNANGDWAFRLSGVELFGELQTPPQ